MSDTTATVVIKPNDSARLVAGHPWLYEASIIKMVGEPADGDLVEVRDRTKRLIGQGLFNSKSRIKVRMLSSRSEPIDEAFFERRLREAIELRDRTMPGATCRRLVSSEGDFLSGLTIDQYEDVLVLQVSSLGMDQRKDMILRILKKLLNPRSILERSDMAFRKFEGMELSQGVLVGEDVATITARLNGISFEVDLKTGHKTGCYLDQQTNYDLVSRFAKGGKVLDCFSFLGGFALHAARAGAKSVHALDQSEDAVGAARRNAEANGLGSICTFETCNVFDWLKTTTALVEGQRVVPDYDLVILDPPSFTRTRSAVEDALRGYKEIHLRAMKLIKSGGHLATFCCSHHVDAALFYAVIAEAAMDAKVQLRRTAIYSQAPDHPVIASIPESEYLKGFAFEIVRPG